MAELPRYRPLGLAIPSVPTVDFTMAGRARARAGDAVAKGLDAMGDYVYKRQVAQTKREAAKYSFENPVTAEQIQDAIAQGRDLEEIVGDPDTVFGSITTATAAQQLTIGPSGVARRQISRVALECQRLSLVAFCHPLHEVPCAIHIGIVQTGTARCAT